MIYSKGQSIKLPARVSTGISGLDRILMGGLVSRRGYLLRGGPGCGKTTVGMQFLAEGIRQAESVLFITLGEDELSLRTNAHGIGIDTDQMHFLDLSPSSDFFSGGQHYDLFSPAEVERDPITAKIIEQVKRCRPQRVFLDSTSHLRYLSIDAYQFRKQLLSFIRFLLEQDATLLFTSESTPSIPDDDVMYLSDGVIHLTLSEFGRRIEVTKFRGSSFKTGLHTFKLTESGAQVFPALRPSEHGVGFSPAKLSSGIDEIDALLNGGIERGTSTVISGPAGVGKTTFGLQFLSQTALSGQRAVLYSFEESVELIISRAESIGIPIAELVQSGKLMIVPIEPLHFSADEIADIVRVDVEELNTRLVLFDSISGYKLSVRDGDIVVSLRSLFKYLTNMGVTVIASNETEAITGDFRATEKGISFMVDNIVFIRYLELDGEMRKAIGVLKKRMSDFERHLREFEITKSGVRVGKPLKNLRGILRGVPEWVKAGVEG